MAHAYFPVYGGDAHFDDAEQWTINSARGTNLFQVAGEFCGQKLFGVQTEIFNSNLKKSLKIFYCQCEKMMVEVKTIFTETMFSTRFKISFLGYPHDFVMFVTFKLQC